MTYSLAFCFLSFLSPLYGAVSVHIQPSSGTLNTVFRLQISSQEDFDKSFDLSVLNSQWIFQGQSQQRRMLWKNGHATQEIVHEYHLKPRKIGLLQIPSFVIGSSQGKRITTPLLEVQVSDLPVEDEAENVYETNELQPLWIKREISRNKIYEGEGVNFTTKIYHRVPLTEARVLPAPMENLRIWDGEQVSYETKDGIHVTALPQALSAQKSGKYFIPPFQMTVKLPSSRRSLPSRSNNLDDLFDDFFHLFQIQSEPRLFRSPGIHLEVLPLPQPIPKNFSGLVGSFTAKASLSQKVLEPGDSTTLTINLSGEGSLDPLGVFPIVLPPSFRIYKDKPKIQEKVTEKGLISQGTYSFSLISDPGTWDLGQLSLCVFDPKVQQYKNLSIPLGFLEQKGLLKAEEESKIAPKTSQQSNLTLLLPSQSQEIPFSQERIFWLSLIAAHILWLGLRIGLSVQKTFHAKNLAWKKFKKNWKSVKDSSDINLAWHVWQNYIQDSFGQNYTHREILKFLKDTEGLSVEGWDELFRSFEKALFSQESVSPENGRILCERLYSLALFLRPYAKKFRL